MTESTPASQPPTVHSALPDLILLRLLCRPKDGSPKKLQDAIAPLFGGKLAASSLNSAIGQLKAEGFLVDKRGQTATDAGRARALNYLGIKKLPPRTNWGAIKAKYLVPRALGLEVGSPDAKKAEQKDDLAARLLRRAKHLPVGTGHTLKAALDALACQVLGFPDLCDWEALRATALGRLIGSEPLDADTARKVVPPAVLDLKQFTPDAVRHRVLTESFAPAVVQRPAPATAVSLDLKDFAAIALKTARACPTGRFGDYKVFINHVWERLKDDPRFAQFGFADFKAKLVEANRAELLSLVPADLNQAFSEPDLVAAATKQLNSTYHLIDTGANQ